jgi:hypothetical protein
LKIKKSNSRDTPATEKQKARLRYFGCTWNENITREQASDLIDEYVKRFPFWNKLPATEEQLAKLHALSKISGGGPEDYYDPEDLNYREAKRLIRIWEKDREVES